MSKVSQYIFHFLLILLNSFFLSLNSTGNVSYSSQCSITSWAPTICGSLWKLFISTHSSPSLSSRNPVAQSGTLSSDGVSVLQFIYLLITTRFRKDSDRNGISLSQSNKYRKAGRAITTIYLKGDGREKKL